MRSFMLLVAAVGALALGVPTGPGHVRHPHGRRVGCVNSVVADLQRNRASAGATRSANLVTAVKPGGGRSSLAPDGLSGQATATGRPCVLYDLGQSNLQDPSNRLHPRPEV